MNNYVFTVTQTGTIDVEANSEEEARSKHDQGLSTTDSYNDEDADGSHQIEEILEEED